MRDKKIPKLLKYRRHIQNAGSVEKYCEKCNSYLGRVHYNKKYCDNCIKENNTNKRLKRQQYNNPLICKICGFKSGSLRLHITKTHGIKLKDYYLKIA